MRERSLGEGEDMGAGIHVVKGDKSSFLVQENPHKLQLLPKLKRSSGRGEGYIAILFATSDGPESELGLQGYVTVPGHIFQADPYIPLSSLPHVHFEVMSPRDEDVVTQDTR